jgi:hypothetical protein
LNQFWFGFGFFLNRFSYFFDKNQTESKVIIPIIIKHGLFIYLF